VSPETGAISLAGLPFQALPVLLFSPSGGTEFLAFSIGCK
jgi:hypothetical protein